MTKSILQAGREELYLWWQCTSCFIGLPAALTALAGDWTTWPRRLTHLESSRTQVTVSASTRTPAWTHTAACVQHSQIKPSTAFLLSHDLLWPPLTLSGWGNENDMRMVDVKYDEYAIIHTIKTKSGVLTVVNKLYGKVVIKAVPHSALWMCSAAQCTHADWSPVVQQAAAWTSAPSCWRSSGSSPWRLESCLKTLLSFPEMVLFT